MTDIIIEKCSNSGNERPKRWLLIRHSKRLVEDRCSRWLHDNGILFDEITPITGESIPPISLYTHLVVFGGVPQVHTKIQPSWMRDELRLIEAALKANVPCLGICLGGQLLAHVLGAQVRAHPEQLREVGYQWVHPANPIDPFLKHSARFLQWHSSGFELPEQCVQLAHSKLFECQAFRHISNSYGIQFHPEVTSNLLRHWQIRHRDAKAAWLGPFARCRHRIDSFRFDTQVTNWFNGFLTNWEHQTRSLSAMVS